MVLTKQYLELSVPDAIGLAYRSYNHAKPNLPNLPDRDLRHPEWTRRLLDLVGSPDADAYNVHVTGSKGKGSHAIFLAGILQQLGLRVGLFTGPHLVDFMERFRVNGQVMPESVFVARMREVWQVAEPFSLPPGQYLGPVGLLAVVAALWFRAQSTDVNIYECGRGARHDDVNQIRHVGAVVSPIFLEHARELGPTEADVAWEKAGVITPDTRWVFSHRQPPAAHVALSTEVASGHAVIQQLGRDFHEALREGGSTDGTRLDVSGAGTKTVLWLPKGLDFLASNAAVTVAAAQQIWSELRPGTAFPAEIDLRDIRLPGRWSVVRESPLTVVDGTIHSQSAAYIARWLEDRRGRGYQGRVGCVLGLPVDKDEAGVLDILAPWLNWLVIARAHNPYLTFGDASQMLAHPGLETHTADYVEDAMQAADERLAAEDVLLILGTQSFVGDALRWFHVDTVSIWNQSGVRGTYT